MKNTLFGWILILLCSLLVCWQILKGTLKYIDSPVVTKVYSEKVDMPSITVCPKISLRMGNVYGLNYDDYREKGRFVPDEKLNVSIKEAFEASIDKFFFLLDVSASKKDCKQVMIDGELSRIYSGNKNTTRYGKPCLSWDQVNHTLHKYLDKEDNNYCRNPGRSKYREYCYINSTHLDYCGVQTCGKQSLELY